MESDDAALMLLLRLSHCVAVASERAAIQSTFDAFAAGYVSWSDWERLVRGSEASSIYWQELAFYLRRWDRPKTNYNGGQHAADRLAHAQFNDTLVDVTRFHDTLRRFARSLSVMQHATRPAAGFDATFASAMEDLQRWAAVGPSLQPVAHPTHTLSSTTVSIAAADTRGFAYPRAVDPPLSSSAGDRFASREQAALVSPTRKALEVGRARFQNDQHLQPSRTAAVGVAVSPLVPAVATAEWSTAYADTHPAAAAGPRVSLESLRQRDLMRRQQQPYAELAAIAHLSASRSAAHRRHTDVEPAVLDAAWQPPHRISLTSPPRQSAFGIDGTGAHSRRDSAALHRSSSATTAQHAERAAETTVVMDEGVPDRANHHHRSGTLPSQQQQQQTAHRMFSGSTVPTAVAPSTAATAGGVGIPVDISASQASSRSATSNGHHHPHHAMPSPVPVASPSGGSRRHRARVRDDPAPLHIVRI